MKMMMTQVKRTQVERRKRMKMSQKMTRRRKTWRKGQQARMVQKMRTKQAVFTLMERKLVNNGLGKHNENSAFTEMEQK